MRDFKLGAWRGVNNVAKDTDKAFQIPGRQDPPAYVVAAQDVDFNNDGWPISRNTEVQDRTLVLGLGGWNVGGRFFFQSADTLYERTSADTALITGLEQRISICEHWGRIFVTDGTNHYEIDGTTVRTWGVPFPTVTLAQSYGNLVPGIYLVQCSFTDSRGNEGGTSDISAITLTTGTGILVDISGYTQDVVSVNIYVSKRDQKQTSYVTTVALGSLPYTIQNDDVTAADPPKTLQMTGPILNASGIFSFRAFMMMWRDGVVFRSEAVEPHLFHGDNFMQFGVDVRACEGLTNGMWIGTEKGLWWVQGDDPDKWIPVRKTNSAVSKGSTKIQGNKLPLIKSDDMLALFATTSGLVAGTQDGSLLHLTDNVYTFDTNTRASFAYVERNGIHQVAINLVGDA